MAALAVWGGLTLLGAFVVAEGAPTPPGDRRRGPAGQRSDLVCNPRVPSGNGRVCLGCSCSVRRAPPTRCRRQRCPRRCAAVAARCPLPPRLRRGAAPPFSTGVASC